MKAIARHRDDILERRRNPRGITKAELEEAGNNYKKLSEDIYARAGSGIFKAQNLPDTLPPESMDMLASAGYLPRAEVNHLLKTDSVFAGAFWQKTAARLGL